MIKAYVDELKQVAAEEDKPGIIVLENVLQEHASTEEEIFFPGAVPIGEYLKLKTEASH